MRCNCVWRLFLACLTYMRTYNKLLRLLSCVLQLNRVVSEGIRYPLEVFKAPGKGFGVCCSVDIAAGSVICAYLGEITTDE